MKQEHKQKISNQEIMDAYARGITLHQAAVELNMTVVTLWRRASSLDIKWSDLRRKSAHCIPLHEILDGKHPSYQTFKLKGKLLSEGVKTNKCEDCGIEEWNGKTINMQLDHVDGNSHNHVLSNLKMLCPNCHSQTITYCGKNK